MDSNLLGIRSVGLTLRIFLLVNWCYYPPLSGWSNSYARFSELKPECGPRLEHQNIFALPVFEPQKNCALAMHKTVF